MHSLLVDAQPFPGPPSSAVPSFPDAYDIHHHHAAAAFGGVMPGEYLGESLRDSMHAYGTSSSEHSPSLSPSLSPESSEMSELSLVSPNHGDGAWERPSWEATPYDSSSDDGSEAAYQPSTSSTAAFTSSYVPVPAVAADDPTRPSKVAATSGETTPAPAAGTSSRPRRAAAAPPPVSQPEKREAKVAEVRPSRNLVRAGSLEVTEEDLLELDIDKLQRLAGQRFSSSDKKELKRLRRKLKNKLSAANSRLKRREYMVDLEEKQDNLADELEFLRRENAELKQEVMLLRAEKQQQSTLAFAPASRPSAVLFVLLLSFGLFFQGIAPLASLLGASSAVVPSITGAPLGAPSYDPAAVFATSRRLLFAHEEHEGSHVDFAGSQVEFTMPKAVPAGIFDTEEENETSSVSWGADEAVRPFVLHVDAAGMDHVKQEIVA